MKKQVKTKISLDTLATMVASGFNSVNENMDQRFNKVDIRLNNLEQGQEQIRLRLDNTAYRFDVQDLKKRVERLESKAGIKH